MWLVFLMFSAITSWFFGNYKRFSLLGLLLSVFIFPIQAALADNVPTDKSLRLVTSSIAVTLAADPGQTISTDIRVKNGGSSSETLAASLLKFGASKDSGRPLLQDKTAADEYISWVTLTPTTFTLAPEQWQTVKMTIVIPKSAAFDYNFAVNFQRATPPPKVTGGRQTSLTGGISSLVLLTVNSPLARKEATLVSFSTDQKIYEFLPAQFNLTLKNSGNVHVAPSGDIFIDQGDRHDLAVIPVNEAKGSILPNTSRTFPISWSDGFPVFQDKNQDGVVVHDNNGQVVKELHWDFSKLANWRFGHFVAHVLIAYDNGHQDIPLEAAVDFWVIPWRIILGLLAVLLVIGIGIYGTLRFTILPLFHRGRKK